MSVKLRGVGIGVCASLSLVLSACDTIEEIEGIEGLDHITIEGVDGINSFADIESIEIIQSGGSDSDEDGESDDVAGTVTGTGTATSTAGVGCDYVDVTYNDSESVQGTSTSTWSCSGTERELTANGLPDHEVGEFPNDGNPNAIAAQTIEDSLTLMPEMSTTATTLGGPAGVTGYVLNGVKIDAGTAGSCGDGDTDAADCSLIDNIGGWSIEALSQDVFDFGTDDNNAHVQPGGQYHYHGMPEGFIAKQGGDDSTMTLIGWAADGFPIYARYGYSVADDASSELQEMTGSYQHVSTVIDSRPSTDVFPLGTFAQDWEYVEGSGDLDECNGRVGVTPEFPGGIYHYYGTDSYPFLQRCVKGEVEVGAGGPPPGEGGADGALPPPPGAEGADEGALPAGPEDEAVTDEELLPPAAEEEVVDDAGTIAPAPESEEVAGQETVPSAPEDEVVAEDGALPPPPLDGEAVADDGTLPPPPEGEDGALPPPPQGG